MPDTLKPGEKRHCPVCNGVRFKQDHAFRNSQRTSVFICQDCHKVYGERTYLALSTTPYQIVTLEDLVQKLLNG